MTNKQVIENFLRCENGKNKLKTLTCRSRILYSYNEPIAFNTGQGLIVLTTEKFSKTTTKYTNLAGKEALLCGFKIFSVKNMWQYLQTKLT